MASVVTDQAQVVRKSYSISGDFSKLGLPPAPKEAKPEASGQQTPTDPAEYYKKEVDAATEKAMCGLRGNCPE